MQYEIGVQSRSRTELVDITSAIQDCVQKSGVQDGVCILFVPHTTAGLTCNENWDPTVRTDILMLLDKIVPQRLPSALAASYAHSEGNSPAHIKASLVGASQTLLVSGGKLVLGTWQGIYLAEFDGPRYRRVLIQILRDTGRP